MTADLARLRWTMDDVPHRLDWITLCALAKHAGEGTALYRVRSRDAPEPVPGAVREVGYYSDWPVDRHIAVMQLDATLMANWQRGNAGRKTPTPPPKPMWRPGVQSEFDEMGFPKNSDGSKQVGHEPIPADQFDSWWGATQAERNTWKGAA